MLKTASGNSPTDRAYCRCYNSPEGIRRSGTIPARLAASSQDLTGVWRNAIAMLESFANVMSICNQAFDLAKPTG